MSTSIASQIVSSVASLQPDVKRGTLRFWGVWFGRPWDNVHRIVSCDADGNTLTMGFDNGETLTIVNPTRFKIDKKTFRIRFADRIVWEWYFYGRPAVPENLYRVEYLRKGLRIVGKSNADWYVPNLKPKAWNRALEIF